MRHGRAGIRGILNVAAYLGAIGLIVVIIWIDVATGLWQDLVILSGLAAGFVSFLFTSLVVKSFVERSTQRRWAPVNRIAVTEFLHSIADDNRSQVAHGIIVPRSLTPPNLNLYGSALVSELTQLRETVALERSALSDALSRWAEFLMNTGDNERALRHVAAIAFQLDRVRDTALEYEALPDEARATALLTEISRCNEQFALLVAELTAQLAADDALELRKRQEVAS